MMMSILTARGIGTPVPAMKPHVPMFESRKDPKIG